MGIEKYTDILRSYGRRKGKTLSPKRKEDLKEILDLYEIDLDDSNNKINPKSFFNLDVKEVQMEIGFGNGEHLIHQAKNNPKIGYIGCEPFINGVAALSSYIKKSGVKNIIIWKDDARLLMSRLENHSLDRLYILHADPWPKKKHHKRRFIQKESLNEISRILKQNAELRMATDHYGLAQWLIEKTYFHPKFEWLAKSTNDWQTPPDDWVDTRYCNKGRSKDHVQVYLNFRNNI